jgi:hypothetical protein
MGQRHGHGQIPSVKLSDNRLPLPWRLWSNSVQSSFRTSSPAVGEIRNPEKLSNVNRPGSPAAKPEAGDDQLPHSLLGSEKGSKPEPQRIGLAFPMNQEKTPGVGKCSKEAEYFLPNCIQYMSKNYPYFWELQDQKQARSWG